MIIIISHNNYYNGIKEYYNDVNIYSVNYVSL